MAGAAPGAVRIFLCGDVMTGRGVDQALPHPGDPELRETYVRSARAYLQLAERANGPVGAPLGFDEIWGAAAELWRALAPDVRIMNLETAITRSDDFAAKGVNYRMDPDNLPALTAAGVDACTLANNHVLDFGAAGLIDTLDALHGAGVATAGAGRTLAEARAPAIRPLPGGRVLLHGAASTDCGVPSDWAAGPRRPGVELTGLSERAGRELGARVAAIRRPGDIVVVSIHWGTNWGYQTPEAHRRFAHALIEAGDVAIVHGHSSHHPRPIEVYRGRLILYGCGDFINDYEGIRGYEEFRSELVAMYFADLERSGALRRLRLAPLRIRRLRLERPEPADVVWLAATLTEQSRPFGTTFEPTPDGMIEVGWSSATQG